MRNSQSLPGLKELADAVRIRNKVLKAFERAEAEDNPSLRQDLLTFVLVGAGPTGIELAASLAVLVRTKLKGTALTKLTRTGLSSAESVSEAMSSSGRQE
jgi:NADH dehydrogenase FAD-containing subunit